jgi:Mg-chelatase subunit ChlD
MLHPIWLFLLIPLGMALWRWQLPKTLRTLRTLLILSLVAAMCGIVLPLPSRFGTLVVVADRSHSMPPNSEAALKEAVDLLQTAMGSEDSLAVVSFGKNTVVERMPQGGKFAGFISDVNKDGSSLAEALDNALALIPQDTPGRVLLLSDGRWTGADPNAVAARAAAHNIAIDYRLVERSLANDVAIARVEMPQSVSPGEGFLVNALISCPLSQDVTFALYKGPQLLASGTRHMTAGLNSLAFRDKASDSGLYRYELKIATTVKDPVPENNIARLLLGVSGQKAILYVGNPDSGLLRLLNAAKLNVRAATPEECHWQIEDLANFKAVILENVPAEQIGTQGMENLAAFVQESGAGMMMTGGKNSFGPGGYFRSPLEPLMPVSMELRREHRKLSLAIVVALDRSGSMAVPVAGGRLKMDLANLSAVQVLDLLSPVDEFGVLAVDTEAHVIAPFGIVQDSSRLRSYILRIESMGGGIYVYTALITAAQMLDKATAGTRHIILFADAADAEEPGQYKELLKKCREAGITVSVIGLGKATDVDAEFLRDVAKCGNGRCFFTENAEELPRLFAQDTFVVARSTFLSETTKVKPSGGMLAITNKYFEPPPIDGYNLCYLRPGANLALVSCDEYAAPIMAAWHVGIGRALCYTGEADGSYTGAIAAWPQVGEFFASMARWTAGESTNLGDMLVTQEVKNGVCYLRLHLDPERKSEAFTTLPLVRTLEGTPGEKVVTQENRMRWVSADMLELSLPLSGQKTAMSTVEIGELGKVTMSPVCLPYSPEFRPAEMENGRPSLERLARASGGKERLDLSGIWQEMPRQTRYVNISRYLIFLAALLLLLEVLERRTGLLSLKWRGIKQRLHRFYTKDQHATATGAAPSATEKAMRRAQKKKPVATEAVVSMPLPKATAQTSLPATPESSQPAAKAESTGAPAPSGMLDALRQAQRKAQERTRREN